MTPRILVAGIGNIFFGDDGFGPEVARRLATRTWPTGVQVVDFGIRGFDLAFALLDGCDAAILVDATQRGGTPGTLYVIEPILEDEPAAADAEAVDTHGMNPVKVLALVRHLSGAPPSATLRVVGCEPERLGDDNDMVMGLSASVAAAVGAAEEMVLRLVEELRTTLADNGRSSHA